MAHNGKSQVAASFIPLLNHTFQKPASSQARLSYSQMTKTPPPPQQLLIDDLNGPQGWSNSVNHGQEHENDVTTKSDHPRSSRSNHYHLGSHRLMGGNTKVSKTPQRAKMGGGGGPNIAIFKSKHQTDTSGS